MQSESNWEVKENKKYRQAVKLFMHLAAMYGQSFRLPRFVAQRQSFS
jgi:hypothetical protein